MKILSFLLLTLLGFSCMNKENAGSESTSDFNMDEYVASLKFLSDDKLQGRLPGTVGADIAAMYIASKFESFKLKPFSPENGYSQPANIESFHPDYKTAEIIITGKGFRENIKPYDEALLTTREKQEAINIEGDMIFVGYGSVAPEYNWDDYKDVDVREKIVVCLFNHPPFRSKDYKPGNTTYYGHFEYKTQKAFEKGAKGIVIIHQNDALLPFNAWRDYAASPCFGENSLVSKIPLVSYISEEGFNRVLKNIDLTTQDLVSQAGREGFKPFPLLLHFNTNFRQNIKEFKSPNVVGFIPGSEKPGEAIVFMAHYDHLGVHKGEQADSIYNGAIDNASGVAGMITLAEYFSKRPAKRSIVFLATTAEEMNFLGVEEYLNNPVIPLDKTIIGLNLDMMNFVGRKDSVELAPLPYTDAIETVRRIADKMKISLKLSDFDSQYLNFRVESFPFATKDILTMNLVNEKIEGQYPSVSAGKLKEIKESGGLNYHNPADEIKAWFRYDGILQELELAREIGIYYANDGIKPKFINNNPYKPVKKLWFNR